MSENDFWALQAAGDWSLPFELIEGEPVTVSSLDPAGVAARDAVRSRLRGWQERVGDDGLVVTATPVALADRTWLLADLAYWSWESLPQRLGAAGERLPDLMVFVQRADCSGTYEQRRQQLAASAGVGDVWTVAPRAQRVCTLRHGALAGEDAVLSPRLKGFHMAASVPFQPRL